MNPVKVAEDGEYSMVRVDPSEKLSVMVVPARWARRFSPKKSAPTAVTLPLVNVIVISPSHVFCSQPYSDCRSVAALAVYEYPFPE